MNEENERERRINFIETVYQKEGNISEDKVWNALKRMMGKMFGLDDISVVVWKFIGEMAISAFP